MSKNNASQDLRAELASLADTLEEVLNQGRRRSRHEVAKLHDRARSTLDSTRDQLGQSGQRVAKSTREAAQKADSYVHDKPWHGVALGAAIGLVASLFLFRR